MRLPYEDVPIPDTLFLPLSYSRIRLTLLPFCMVGYNDKQLNTDKVVKPNQSYTPQNLPS